MNDERRDDWVDALRERYNAPADTPRDEMWAAIAPRLGPRETGVVSLDDARARRRTPPPQRMVGWAVAAAAFVVLGIGIGRATAPQAPGEGSRGGALAEGESSTANAAPLRVAAIRHLERSEGLLTMVRADGRAGRVDREVGAWAVSLLAQTRLLLDHADGMDPPMRALLEDLELVLVQVVGASALGDVDASRASAEMSLTLDAIERREVVPRIQALVPVGPGLAGV